MCWLLAHPRCVVYPKAVIEQSNNDQGDSMAFAVSESKKEPGTFFAAVSYTGAEIVVVNFYWVFRDLSGEVIDMNHRECRIYPEAVYGDSLLESDALSDLLNSWIWENESLSDHPVNFYPKQIGEISFGQMRQQALIAFLESQGGSEFEMPSDKEIAAFLDTEELLDFRTRRELLAAIEQLRVTGIYSDAVDRGEPKPALIVADRLDDPSPQGIIRARNLIQFARKNGLLSKSQTGLPGGVPTQKAVEMATRIRSLARSHQGRGKK
jgi:hypothetical protein